MSEELLPLTEEEKQREELRNQGLRKPVILVIKERFLKELESKTSWGKNEIKALYDDITTEELAKELNRLHKEILNS